MRRSAWMLFVACTGCSMLVSTGDLAGGSDRANDDTTRQTRTFGEDSGALDAAGTLPGIDAGTADAGYINPPAFFDDFNRPNGAVGNGWIEKTVGLYRIAGGRLAMQPGDYRNSLLYRSAAEDAQNVEVSIEVQYAAIPGTTPSNDPQVMARLQANTVTMTGAMDTYMAWIDNGVRFRMGRHRGSLLVILAQASLAETVATTHLYRLHLAVTGSMPVMLRARLVRMQEASNSWTELNVLDYSDDSVDRILSPGSVGTSSDDAVSFVYDNFRRTPL